MSESLYNAPYFLARIENDKELVMEPYCKCGTALNEDYFCEKCKTHCQCLTIICEDEETISLVRKFIKQNPRFSRFTPILKGQ